MQLAMTRPWKFLVNILSPVTGASGVDTAARAMRTLVNTLLGTGTFLDRMGITTTPPANPWTVVGSSNGVAAAMDGVNRWAADSDLVWAASGVARSWIVLQQTGITTKFQLLIALESVGATKTRATVVISPRNGFGVVNGGTDGSITARPTAVDAITLGSNADWGIGTNVTTAQRFHVLMSDDGADTKVLFTRANTLAGMWSFAVPSANEPTIWLEPSVSMFDANSQPIPSNDYITRPALMSTSKFFGRIMDVTGCSFLSTAESVASGAIPDVQVIRNDATHRWPITDIGLYSTSSNDVGHHGRHIDMGWSVAALLNGVKFPDAVAGEWVRIGAFTLPWAAGVPIDMTP